MPDRAPVDVGLRRRFFRLDGTTLGVRYLDFLDHVLVAAHRTGHFHFCDAFSMYVSNFKTQGGGEETQADFGGFQFDAMRSLIDAQCVHLLDRVSQLLRVYTGQKLKFLVAEECGGIRQRVLGGDTGGFGVGREIVRGIARAVGGESAVDCDRMGVGHGIIVAGRRNGCGGGEGGEEEKNARKGNVDEMHLARYREAKRGPGR